MKLISILKLKAYAARLQKEGVPVPTKQETIKRFRALFLAAMLTVILLASVAVMALEIGHVCGGSHCPICEGILTLHSALVHLALVAAVLACRRTHRPANYAMRALTLHIAQCTPVTLCNRMND